jgi:hypothetical protein
MTSTMKSDPLLSVVRASTSAGAVPSAVIVMTGGAAGREGGGTVGCWAPINSVGATSAAAPASPPVRRKSRRSIDTGGACFCFFDRAIRLSLRDHPIHGLR